MLITDKEKYINSLVTLWEKVFGDSEDYIRLYFKEAYYDGECFAEIVDDVIVSSFYLLKCSIKCQGKIYYGRYLYAAATLPEYRGNGLMPKLIREAESYCKNEKLDFIALVPAEDWLYDYYSKFVFKESMYKYKHCIDKNCATMMAYREITDSDEFNRKRNSVNSDMLVYNEVSNRYAFECMSFIGTRLFDLGENSYYAEDEELLCADNETAIKLINNLCGESVIYTNCEVSSSEKIRNGMILSLKDDLKFKDIYMNIALD